MKTDIPTHPGNGDLQTRPAKQPLVDDLEMLNRAAETMKRAEDRAVETQGRAQTMVIHAQAELKMAERLLQESEAARIAAETEQRKAKAKLEEFEKLLEARSEQIHTIRIEAEEQCKAAERRAQEAEDELEALREAIKTLLGQQIA